MRRIWFLLLLSPVLLQPQQQRNDELSNRQTLNDAAVQQTRKSAAVRMREAAEILQALQDDADRLNKLSQELKDALALNASNVLTDESLKRNDEMEKLVKRIKSTMKRAAGK
jgi:hypothetical protein